jgi:hypothetical protein
MKFSVDNEGEAFVDGLPEKVGHANGQIISSRDRGDAGDFSHSVNKKARWQTALGKRPDIGPRI